MPNLVELRTDDCLRHRDRPGTANRVSRAAADNRSADRPGAAEVGIVVVAPALVQQDQLGAKKELAPMMADKIFTAKVDQVVTQPAIDLELVHDPADE